ncbi:UNVERIFIED_ORG: hypothetical protein LHK14_13355 [Roseateles sp. XES5]|nr:hypothetical protein [Roseateles sp. XES5]
MPLKPARWDDLLRDLETTGDWSVLTITLEIHRAGVVSRWHHAHENWPLDDGLDLDNLIQELSEFAVEYPSCWTFLHHADDVGLLPDQVLSDWKLTSPNGVYLRCSIDGSFDANHWFAAMFADDRQGKDAATVFKLALPD